MTPADGPPRIVVRGGRVHENAGRPRVRDLHVSGPVLTALDASGPPREPDVVIEAAGASVVPLLTDSVPGGPPEGLGPGDPATFAVVRGSVGTRRVRSLLVAPRDLVAAVVEGRLCVRDGVPLLDAGPRGSSTVAAERWCGAWRDRGSDLVQHLLPDGRYTETRGGRVDAYTGRYWLVGDHVLYLDDSGFWADGRLIGDVLHHAGFVMDR